MKKIKVVMCPSNVDYIKMMKDKLQERGIGVSLIRYVSPISMLKLLILRARGFRILHIHFVYIFPSILIMKFFVRFCKLIKYKIVWTVHNVLPHHYSKEDVHKTKWFFHNVDYRFVHYQTNIKKLLELGLETKSISVIDHPVYNLYPNDIDQTTARNKLGIPLDKKVLLSFGQIRKYKGLDYFVESLKSLGNEYYGLIVGQGKEREIIHFLRKKEKEMNNLIVVEGFIPQDEIQVYMNACDVVVLPYTEISTSGVTLLAYAFAKPVISTDVGCMREVITDETGLVTKPKNSKALTDAIREIFTKNYVQMGERAYDIAQEKYSWNAMIDKVVEGYQRILEE